MNAKLGQVERAGQDPSPPTTRVVAILELLSAGPAPARTLAEITSELGISRSTGHAILQTLDAHGWVRRDPLSGTYAIGHRFPRAPRMPATGIAGLRGPLIDLAADLGIAVCVSEVQGSSIVVVESIGAGSGSPPLSPGLRLPFVAPFGREFVAWAPARAQRDWVAAAGPVNKQFRTRISLVLDTIRQRGYGVERLSDELNRVVTALLALDDDHGSEAIAARLAGALADLTVVDVLGKEASSGRAVAVATVSAPIRDSRGAVALTISAQPYRELTTDAIDRLGAQVRAFAGRASDLLGSGPGQREPRRANVRGHA